MNYINNLQLHGKGLFIFSDPGGAKPLLSLICLLQFKEYKIISDRTYDFYKDFGLEVELYKENDEITELENYRPDFVFTATSYTSSLEIKFINRANNLKIPTYSFIDHYTNYNLRFKLNSKYIYPKYICLIDEKSVKIAQIEKLDLKSNFIITGNFYHDFLKGWKPLDSKSLFFKSNRLNLDKKVIVVALEPLSNIGGLNTYGFDESVVLKIIHDTLIQIPNNDFQVVLKLHPNQNVSNLRLSNNFSNFFIIGDGIHTNSLIFYSDIIIGMYSSFLIESSLFNKKILRVLPKQKFVDPLGGLNIGIICSNSIELLINLQ
jgi:hypothetical protein